MQTDSTDDQSAWSLFKCARDKHFFSNAAEQRKLPPPTYLDRTVLERRFQQLENNNQLTDGDEQPRMMINSYSTENACLKRTIKEIETKKKYEVKICKEYKQLQKDFTALKDESMQILNYSNQVTDEKWRRIADSIQNYLKRVREFFDCERTHINSMADTLTLRDRTLALEKLKKLYTNHVSQMDEWIEIVVSKY
ncbi:uncharacterized protein LOC112599099 isoform X2 [Melanaphis sacchari]|uniref:uncharacterized protein LOC112599099 isoform X2 n=1 Tax=Melanaphis sacchari TaxID=742174 RepID=UPI000DC14186|nr:uncharacterized protein LOC112599099 isoform X2 [Melanaphis sacchari]